MGKRRNGKGKNSSGGDCNNTTSSNSDKFSAFDFSDEDFRVEQESRKTLAKFDIESPGKKPADNREAIDKHVLLDFSMSSHAKITANINSIPTLNGSNFKSWKENLLIVLGVHDLDLALRVDSPPPLTDRSTPDDKRDMKRWKKSNRMCLMIMKKTTREAFRDTISDSITTAKGFLVDIEKTFVKNRNSKIGALLTNLISMRYTGQGNVGEYIVEISHLASKLRALKLELSEELLVHLVLISLPSRFNQFKVSYNCQKDTWSLNELISHCVQEEDRVKQDNSESAHLESTFKGKGIKRKKDTKAAITVNPGPQKKQDKKLDNSENKGCFICGVKRHVKKHCLNYHAWRAKKCEPLNLICCEDCLYCRKPNDGERYIYVGATRQCK